MIGIIDKGKRKIINTISTTSKNAIHCHFIRYVFVHFDNSHIVYLRNVAHTNYFNNKNNNDYNDNCDDGDRGNSDDKFDE